MPILLTSSKQRLAFEKLKQGEIDAMIWVQGKPSKFSTIVKDKNFHLIPVDYAQSLQPDYLPAQLTSEDYPNLIAKGERIDTIAAPAVLAVYNWPPNTDHYRRLVRFIDAFFGKITTLQQSPFHPMERGRAPCVIYPAGHGSGQRRNGSIVRECGWRPLTCDICSNSS
jgi:hypothetical protein